MSVLRTFGAVLASLLAVGPAAAAPWTVTGADGRTVEIADASRIVSIGGAVTETLYALGLDDRVVGIDLTSTFPRRAQAKPSVGYMRALSAEGVLSLAPTLIVAVEDAGPKETVDVLAQASVPFVLVPKAGTAEEVAGTIRFIAEVAGEPEKGEALAAAVAADLKEVERRLSSVAERRRAVFVLSLIGGSPTAAGTGTGAADLFTLAHVDNALADMQGYKAVSDEAAIAAAPDAIVLMAERSDGVSDSAVLGAPAFSGSPAAQSGRLIRLSGAYLLNFGPRTAHAVRDLAAAIYPELGLEPLPERPWTVDAPAED